MISALEKYTDQFPEIRTERLRLRRIGFSDAPDWLKTVSDPIVMEYYNHPPILTTEEIEQNIHKIHESFREAKSVRWAIENPADQKMIGSIGFVGDPRNPFSAEIGYELQRDQWSNGYAREALEAILHYGFETLGLGRIFARVMPANTASVNLLERAGFTREGLLREEGWWKNELHDLYLYSLLKSDRIK